MIDARQRPATGAAARQDETCVFCEIIGGRAPAEMVYENDHALAILDIRPIHHGHSLVIPKVHCQDFLGLPKEYLGGVLEAAQTVARATVRALSLEGFNVFCNNGPVAGQSVFHFHMHVTPRYRDDRIRFELTLKHYQDGEMRTMAQNIRTHLSEHSR